MELTNTFVVDAPVQATWAVLTDLERVAPCLPGATLTGIDGDTYQGQVKIKVGPVTAAYEGTARFAERDDGAHRGVIRAEARKSRGQDGASATITAELTEHGRGTQVCLLTDLALSGRVAQFGRGVISDVSAKLIGQFATRLEQEITPGGTAPTDPTPAVAPDERTSTPPSRQNEGLALPVLTSPLLRRAAPALGAAGALLAGFLLGRIGRSSRAARSGGGGPAVRQLVLPTPTTEAPR